MKRMPSKSPDCSSRHETEQYAFFNSPQPLQGAATAILVTHVLSFIFGGFLYQGECIASSFDDKKGSLIAMFSGGSCTLSCPAGSIELAVSSTQDGSFVANVHRAEIESPTYSCKWTVGFGSRQQAHLRVPCSCLPSLIHAVLSPAWLLCIRSFPWRPSLAVVAQFEAALAVVGRCQRRLPVSMPWLPLLGAGRRGPLLSPLV